jgi:hypothetical protein
MNDVREAADRIGAKFDPNGDGLADLHRRRSRARRRRSILAGLVAVLVAGGSLVLVRTLPNSTTRHRPKVKVIATWAVASPATSASPVAAVDCPTPSGDSPPPVVLSSTSAAPASMVEVSGTFQTKELWMQLWWNAGQIGDQVAPPPWPPIGPELPVSPARPGPVVKLAAVAGPSVTGECSFHTEFVVPDVAPGTYQLAWVFGALGDPTPPDQPGDFYAFWSSELSFDVMG